MRLLALAAVAALAAGCSSGPSGPTGSTRAPEAMKGVSVSGASAARNYSDLDPYNGQEVSLTGTFSAKSRRARIGILTLASGLRVGLPHFDQFQHGNDWLKYEGRVCQADGILHTYTKDVDGYRMPTLQLKSFSGPSE